VAADVLVFESAVDYHPLVKVSTIPSVEDFEHSVARDARDAIALAFRNEVRKSENMRLFNVHDGLES
jgi:hypothetical protein